MEPGDTGVTRAGAFAGHIEPGNSPALLLVDMVQAYLQADSPLYCDTAAAALNCALKLLGAARSGGRPVVFTNVVYAPGGTDGGIFYKKVPALKVFERGSPLGDFPPTLRPSPEELVVTKQYPSAFFKTGLDRWLAERGVDTLVIAGFSTSGCVRASGLDALQYGFAPFIVREACADRQAETHEANLSDLQAKYAEVCTPEFALSILNSDA
ncbi:isochorismatase family protein [Novosphingobium tardum]|uniref:Isochorismatase family protein n=1 Tax=Novosphingobium tardum TaxID=1538021 RepID=A0ABV8RSL5_9SPHN